MNTESSIVRIDVAKVEQAVKEFELSPLALAITNAVGKEFTGADVLFGVSGALAAITGSIENPEQKEDFRELGGIILRQARVITEKVVAYRKEQEAVQ